MQKTYATEEDLQTLLTKFVKDNNLGVIVEHEEEDEIRGITSEVINAFVRKILKQDTDKKTVSCCFNKRELEIACEALNHLHSTNGEYLKWKTDSFSQEQIPIHMKNILALYLKINKLRA